MRAGFLLLLGASLGLVGACSLSFDDLKQNAGKGADAGFDGPIEGGKCEHSVDCSGCADCNSWCNCVAPNVVAKCISDCSAATGGVGGNDASVSGGGTGGTSSGGTSSGGTSSGGASSGGTSSGGTSSGGTSSGGTSSGGTSSGGTSSGGTSSGGGTGGVGGHVAGQVICGSTTCSADSQECCGTSSSGFTCQPVTTSCTGATMTCDGPEDCFGNQVCCGTSGSGPQFGTVACASTCGGTQTQHIACDPNNPTCTAPLTCQPSAILPGYYFCG